MKIVLMTLLYFTLALRQNQPSPFQQLSGRASIPVQQPVVLNGGAFPPLNVYHNPIYMNANNQLPPEELAKIQTLQKLDSDLSSMMQQPRFLQQQPQPIPEMQAAPAFSPLQADNQAESQAVPLTAPPQEEQLNLTKSPSVDCLHKEGMLKIRDADQKGKEVKVTYAVLTANRLTYFVNPVSS